MKDKVQGALEDLIAHLDYDQYKYLKSDEMTGEDHFLKMAEDFMKELGLS